MSSAASLEGHGLGRTGQFVAACRAVESRKAPELGVRKLYDPWAAQFAAAEGFELLSALARAKGKSEEELSAGVVARTCYFDDALLRVLNRPRPETRQCVIAGVGGDARGYRLPLPPGVVVYEVDFPQVLRYRQAVFASGPHPPTTMTTVARAVGADLTREDWVDKLTSAGFDPAKASVWLLEGLLRYLTEQQCKTLTAQISSLCQPGSMLCCNVTMSEVIKKAAQGPGAKVWSDFGAELAQSGIDDPKQYFAEYGFETTTIIGTMKLHQECGFGVGKIDENGGQVEGAKEEEEEDRSTSFLVEAVKI